MKVAPPCFQRRPANIPLNHSFIKKGLCSMKRYYDPEIFLQMLDGIDLDTHVVASYYLRDRLEGQKFLDHLALVQALAVSNCTRYTRS
jgi:hypothetical protein